ncbi:MAG TPA: DUF1353 domain-containing protein [Pyrinomonadaceae bacterium]|jgi:hypothetical protein
MKIEDLKKQFEEIEKKIDAGEAVQINLNDGGKDVRLEVDSSGAEEVSAKPQTPEEAAFDSLEAMDDEEATDKYDFNLSAADISDGEIANIIDSVPPLEASADVPEIVLTRDGSDWVLFQDCSYKTKLGYEVTALKGFRTDLASIPRVFWAILSAEELSLAAPVFHDLLYRCGGTLPGNQINPSDGKKFQRKEVDGIFLELMEKSDIPKWKREVAYYAVRSFAGFAWKG